MSKKEVNKTEISTIAEKNRIVSRFSKTFKERDTFLLLGHQDPDTDCIAALVAFALLLVKFQKDVTIYLATSVMAQFNYLVAICKYNGISVVYGKQARPDPESAVVVLDTPKPDMIALNDDIASLIADPKIRKLEVDHHLAGDASYSGDPGYCLVSGASSTCELIGYLILKLHHRKEYSNIDFFTRNLALAVLTGIVGDSQMGKYLKTNKEKFYYRIFSELFSRLLTEKTLKNTNNISSMEAVFDVIKNFSVQQRHCFESIMEMKNAERSIHYISIDPEKSAEFFEEYGEELIVNVSKAAADTLAEDCGKLGMVVYYDDPALSDFVQFRLRRSARFIKTDLRDVLTGLNIENGGGHPGAIGFRVRKGDIQDIADYVPKLVDRIEDLVKE